jgi:GNAT superfamily N-acetyltransferase
MQRTPADPPPYQIHHYPTALIDSRTLRDGQRLTLRPVLPQDVLLIGELMLSLSPAALRQRFHGAVRLSVGRLVEMSCVDYARQLALVVTAHVDGTERVIADARYWVDDDQTAEFDLVVDKRWQRLGIGAWALAALQQAATAAGANTLRGRVQSSNAAMLALALHCGFDCSDDPEDDQRICVAMQLGCAGPAGFGLNHKVSAWLARFGLRFQLPLTPRLAS